MLVGTGFYFVNNRGNRRSQWSFGLRHEMSSAAQALEGFESHSRHGCLSAFVLCLCCPVYVVALYRAGPLSKESYQLSTRFTVSELILNGNRSESQIRQGRNRRTQFRYFIKITSDIEE
jgi:hypothetical protein